MGMLWPPSNQLDISSLLKLSIIEIFKNKPKPSECP